MGMKFTTITKNGSKWLRPVNPFDNNDPRFTSKEPFCMLGMRPCSKTVCECDEWKKFEKNNPILPYIGSHPEGTTVDESEVREVRQHRHVFDPERAFFTLNNNTLWLWEHRDAHSDIEFRTAYTDAEPPDIDYEKEMPHKKWPSTKYVARKMDAESHDRHISGWTHVSDALPEHLETVWLSNGKGFTTLGCLVWTEDGWHWAATNGVIYEENGRIVSECESDDIDAEYWHGLPDALKIDKEESK